MVSEGNGIVMPFDDDDRAYEAMVDFMNGPDYDPNDMERFPADEMPDPIHGVHTPGQMNVFQCIRLAELSDEEDIPF